MNKARNEETSKPQTSDHQAVFLAEKQEAKDLALSKVSSAEWLKTCLQLLHLPTGRPF